MMFVFLEGLGLRLTHISRQKIMGLSYLFVFVPILVLLTNFDLFFLG